MARRFHVCSRLLLSAIVHRRSTYRSSCCLGTPHAEDLTNVIHDAFAQQHLIVSARMRMDEADGAIIPFEVLEVSEQKVALVDQR